MLRNKHGLAFTAASQDAVDAYDNLIDHFFQYSRQTGDVLNDVLERDPDMVLAHCVKGYFLNLMANAGAAKQAEAALAAAKAGAAKATPRETLHVAALEAWCAGNIDGVIAAWETLLLDDPRDIIVLKLVQSAHFYRGDSANIRDCIARVMPAWDEGVPGYSHVLGMRAFGLEESGDYPAAEAAGRRAIEMNPRDPWAVHAVAHVLEMQDRHADGVAWMAGLEEYWDAANNFRNHLWWHRSLYHFDREDYATVLDYYDNHFRQEKTDEIRDIANAVAMLLRLEFRGVDVGDRWDELSMRSVSRIHEHLMPFHDTHFLLALACGGRPDVAAEMVESMRAYVANSKASAVPTVRDVCIPLAGALIAYSGGNYGRTVDLLAPVRYGIQQIGGSHAQRDLFAELLVEAALKAGRFPLARALLAERSALQPNNAPVWKAYARALDGVGDAAGASAARDRAAEILAA
jgi:tetratricopeptide (TPR) repeat protein